MESLYCFTNSTASKQLPVLCTLMLTLSACAGPQSTDGDGVNGAPAEGSPVVQETPPQELPPTDAEVMYRVFAGEYLGSEGDMEKAAQEYLAAALGSDDPELAERATAVALAAEAWQYAAMAADRWVYLAPDSIRARETAARTLLIAGDYVGAEHQMQGLLEVMEDDPVTAWNTVANLLAVAGHPEKVQMILARLTEDNGAEQNPYAIYAQSQLMARNADLANASHLAEQAVTLAPDEAALHAWAGRLAANMGEQEVALGHFQSAWELEPEDRSYALMYANLLRQQGQGGKANDILGELPDEPELRFTRVAFAIESDDPERAETLYRGFETAGYDDASAAAYEAARSAELLEMPGEAIEWYAKVTDGERALVAVIRQAVLLAEMGRLDEARAVLAEARRNGDAATRQETLIAESQLLLDADLSSAAYDMLTQALSHAPNDNRLLYTRALVAVELERLEVAESDLRAVLASEPQNAAALNALGYTLADRTKRFEEAEQLINQAYSLQPDEASIIDSMGWVAYRLGRLDEAETYLREAFRRDRNAEIAAHLGEVLWVQGRESEARQIWQQGQLIDSENRVLIETLARFEVKL